MYKKKLINLLKKLGNSLLKTLDDLLLILGMSILTVGVSKIYIPAGYITLGICLIAFAFLIAKKGG